MWLLDATQGISTGNTLTYTIAISSTAPFSATARPTSGPLAITLAWTDYPGYEMASKGTRQRS
ncbi:MAG: hypothetical protein HC893_01550 [Chloroflexaceae bacterium]|nr:hypothetical protein [Chloroflexaceae bacterium]